MLDFWETVRGARLADTLTRELPRLTAKKKQRIMLVDDNDDLQELKKALEKGERVITSISVEGHTYVILEKEEP